MPTRQEAHPSHRARPPRPRVSLGVSLPGYPGAAAAAETLQKYGETLQKYALQKTLQKVADRPQMQRACR
jgi:hypothetical protein